MQVISTGSPWQSVSCRADTFFPLVLRLPYKIRTTSLGFWSALSPLDARGGPRGFIYFGIKAIPFPIIISCQDKCFSFFLTSLTSLPPFTSHQL